MPLFKNLQDEKIEMDQISKNYILEFILMFVPKGSLWGNCILGIQNSTFTQIPVKPINYDKISGVYFTISFILM